MKKLAAANFLVVLAIFHAKASDFTLIINGETLEIELNKLQEYRTPGGEVLKFILEEKETKTFKSHFFSMSHRKTLSPDRTDMGEGLFQTMMMTPNGSGVLIQEYKEMDPTSFLDLMADELTKEEVSAGYKLTETNTKKKVGKYNLKGKELITRNSDYEWHRGVYVCGSDQNGIIIITMIEQTDLNKEGFVLSEFWDSLKINL